MFTAADYYRRAKGHLTPCMQAIVDLLSNQVRAGDKKGTSSRELVDQLTYEQAEIAMALPALRNEGLIKTISIGLASVNVLTK